MAVSTISFPEFTDVKRRDIEATEFVRLLCCLKAASDSGPQSGRCRSAGPRRLPSLSDELSLIHAAERFTERVR